MTYLEIRTALKSFQAQGHTIPPLNSKKEVLEIALQQLQATTTALIEVTPAVIVEPTPVVVTTSGVTPQRITPEHPAVTEVKELARLTEVALVWTIAIVRSLLRFSIPYLIRGADIALRIAVYAGVLIEVWLVPKVQLIAYRVATWAILTIVKIRNYQRTAIA